MDFLLSMMARMEFLNSSKRMCCRCDGGYTISMGSPGDR
jgi:hypothetical protein